MKLERRSIGSGLVLGGRIIKGKRTLRGDRIVRNGLSLRSRLVDDLSIRFLHLFLNCMDEVVSFINDCVITTRSWWDGVINDYLRQVPIGVNSCHLLQAIVKLVTIVAAALIIIWLRGPEPCYDVGLGFLHLLTKGDQLHLQIGVHLLQLFMATSLLL